MTTNKTFSEFEGTLNSPSTEKYVCRKCNLKSVIVQDWDSSCGGYTDYKYTCESCGYYWWVDGPDA